VTEISCVIPTLNSGWSLAETIHSIVSQKDCTVRVIVVDSGSTDETLDVCKRWNVPTVYVPPGNMYRAINEGLKACDTPWLAYLNSDDLLYPRSFARLISLGGATRAGVVYGACDYVDSEGRFLHSLTPAYSHELLSLFRLGIPGFAQPAAIFRKTVFDALNGFDQSYTLNADFDFYWRALIGGVPFACLTGSPVARFRLHRKQLSHTQSEVMRQQLRSMRTKIGAAHASDYLRFLRWRVRNVPQYLIRITRRALLAKQLKIPTTMDSCDS